mmetsp:Transcript_27385/g.82069  ORF Transcript_27385/g.82069 Transcript_27385/m.82069 type:complete len:710 (+) Transcript_27385:3-2132(+)
MMSSEDPPGMFLNRVVQMIVGSRVARNPDDELYGQDYGGLRLENRKSVDIDVRNALKRGAPEGGGHAPSIELTVEVLLRNGAVVERWYCSCRRHLGSHYHRFPVLYRALYSRLRVLPVHWELKTRRTAINAFTYKLYSGGPKSHFRHEQRVINSDHIHLSVGYSDEISALLAAHMGSAASQQASSPQGVGAAPTAATGSPAALDAAARSMRHGYPTAADGPASLDAGRYPRGHASQGVAIPGARSRIEPRRHSGPDHSMRGSRGDFHGDPHDMREHPSSYGGAFGRERTYSLADRHPPSLGDRTRSSSFGHEHRQPGVQTPRERRHHQDEGRRPLHVAVAGPAEEPMRGRVQSMPVDMRRPDPEPLRRREGGGRSHESEGGADVPRGYERARAAAPRGSPGSAKGSPDTRRRRIPRSTTNPGSPDTRRRGIPPSGSGGYRPSAGPGGDREHGLRASPRQGDAGHDAWQSPSRYQMDHRSERSSQPVNIPHDAARREGGFGTPSSHGLSSASGSHQRTPPWSVRSGPDGGYRAGSLPTGRNVGGGASNGSSLGDREWLPFGGNSPSDRYLQFQSSPGSYGSSNLRTSHSAEHASPAGLRNMSNLSDSRATLYSEDDAASSDSYDMEPSTLSFEAPGDGSYDELPFAMDDTDELEAYAQKMKVMPRLNMFASRRQDITESIHSLDLELQESIADHKRFAAATSGKDRKPVD